LVSLLSFQHINFIFMQYTVNRPSSPLTDDQYGWPKISPNQTQLAWNLSFEDVPQVRPDYLSPESSSSEEHQTFSSYSTNSSYSLPSDTGVSALGAAYNASDFDNVKGEDFDPSPTSLNGDNNLPQRKRVRAEYDDEYSGPNSFTLTPSITIPSSPSNPSAKAPPSQQHEIYSNSISPNGSPQSVSYSMLVQDALSCFLPKPTVVQYDSGDDHEPESVGKMNRIAHNAIERRYRNNINDCLNDLKDSVPALKFARVKDNTIDDSRSAIDNGFEKEDELIDGVPVATKLNKATILRKATEYISHLKSTLEQCESENKALQNLILQLPRGQEVVTYYRTQKQQFEVYERERMAVDRQLAFERRQREKREARHKSKLLRRGQLSLPELNHRRKSSSSSSAGQTFMVLFLGMTFFSNTNYLHAAHNVSDGIPHATASQSISYFLQNLDIWYVLVDISFLHILSIDHHYNKYSFSRHIVRIFLVLMAICSIGKAFFTNGLKVRKCKNRGFQKAVSTCDCE
jgi:hypothetical protein